MGSLARGQSVLVIHLALALGDEAEAAAQVGLLGHQTQRGAFHQATFTTRHIIVYPPIRQVDGHT